MTLPTKYWYYKPINVNGVFSQGRFKLTRDQYIKRTGRTPEEMGAHIVLPHEYWD